MKVIRVIPVFSLLFTFFVFADNNEMTGFEFLRTPLHARSAAMGGAFSGADGDLASVIYNPSGLAGLSHSAFLFTFMDYFADFKAGSIAYGLPISNGRVIGFSASYMSYGEMTWTDIRGESTGTSTPGDLLLSATYAGVWSPSLSYGASLKFIRSQIDQYNAEAFAVDAGAHFKLKGDLNLGFSIRNLGAAVSGYVDEKDNLPTALCGGFSKTLAHLPLTLNFQILRYQYQKSNQFLGLYWALGGEFKLSENVFLRWGYDSVGEEQKIGTERDRLTGVTLGFGCSFSQYGIHYAFGHHGVLDATHQFTVAYDL